MDETYTSRAFEEARPSRADASLWRVFFGNIPLHITGPILDPVAEKAAIAWVDSKPYRPHRHFALLEISVKVSKGARLSGMPKPRQGWSGVVYARWGKELANLLPSNDSKRSGPPPRRPN